MCITSFNTPNIFNLSKSEPKYLTLFFFEVHDSDDLEREYVTMKPDKLRI